MRALSLSHYASWVRLVGRTVRLGLCHVVVRDKLQRERIGDSIVALRVVRAVGGVAYARPSAPDRVRPRWVVMNDERDALAADGAVAVGPTAVRRARALALDKRVRALDIAARVRAARPCGRGAYRRAAAAVDGVRRATVWARPVGERGEIGGDGARGRVVEVEGEREVEPGRRGEARAVPDRARLWWRARRDGVDES